MQIKNTKRCAYCREVLTKETKSDDHVFPECLYPNSRRSTYRPIKVPACRKCNNSWSESEAHFRNVLTMAGDANQPIFELFNGKIQRSFYQVDGQRRVRDLQKIMKPVRHNGRSRLKIYPAEDPSILNVIRKIVIGLYYHHGLGIALDPNQIWADVQRFQVPPAFLKEMTAEYREADIIQYRYSVLEDKEMHSSWIFLFFERTPFMAIVMNSKVKVSPTKNHTQQFHGANLRSAAASLR